MRTESCSYAHEPWLRKSFAFQYMVRCWRCLWFGRLREHSWFFIIITGQSHNVCSYQSSRSIVVIWRLIDNRKCLLATQTYYDYWICENAESNKWLRHLSCSSKGRRGSRKSQYRVWPAWTLARGGDEEEKGVIARQCGSIATTFYRSWQRRCLVRLPWMPLSCNCVQRCAVPSAKKAVTLH